jgi:hypothetical protein
MTQEELMQKVSAGEKIWICGLDWRVISISIEGRNYCTMVTLKRGWEEKIPIAETQEAFYANEPTNYLHWRYDEMTLNLTTLLTMINYNEKE